MKIFWSWQSDTPGKTGRHFVRAALEAAIERVRESKEIEEPSKRDLWDAMHLDQDRQGVSGTSELARTI
jgi:phytoene/squalene synthetase